MESRFRQAKIQKHRTNQSIKSNKMQECKDNPARNTRFKTQVNHINNQLKRESKADHNTGEDRTFKTKQDANKRHRIQIQL